MTGRHGRQRRGGEQGGLHAGRPRRGSGRKRKGLVPLIAVAAVALVTLGAAVGLRYAVLLPTSVAPGDNLCLIGRYPLAEQGFDLFEDLVARSEGMAAQQNVAYFEAHVDNEGAVESFRLSLDTFDESGAYTGLASYDYADRNLSYAPPAPDNLDLVHTPNPNSELGYLGGLVRTVPLAEQIRVSGLARYVVSYQPSTVVEAGTPIFDGRGGKSFEPLGPDAYNAGAAGVSQGDTNVVIRLNDGQSTFTGQQYLYVFDPTEPAKAEGNPLVFKQGDYAIDGGTLKLTTDYGQSWFDAGLTAAELDETLAFYQSALTLPPTSLFVTGDAALPLAYFYGGQPVLKLSHDGGASWQEAPFPTAAEFGRAITRRAVGFASPQFGYAALGTDWSMGAGEHKMAYFSTDGGLTWTPKELPLTMTSSTLLDLVMADERNGALVLDGGSGVYLPLVFTTADGGDTWQQVALDYGSLPPEVSHLSTAEGLAYEDGAFALAMGQGDAGTHRATFTSASIAGPWALAGTGEAAIHTVG